jgi:hypothetical protein
VNYHFNDVSMYTETWLISTTIREGRCTQKHGSSLQQFVKVDVHRSMAHLYNNSWRSMYTETWLISTTIREAGFRDFWEEFNLSDNVLGETFVSEYLFIAYKGTTICYLQNFPEKNPTGIALSRTYHLVKLANLCRVIKY